MNNLVFIVDTTQLSCVVNTATLSTLSLDERIDRLSHDVQPKDALDRLREKLRQAMTDGIIRLRAVEGHGLAMGFSEHVECNGV